MKYRTQQDISYRYNKTFINCEIYLKVIQKFQSIRDLFSSIRDFKYIKNVTQ